MVFPFPQSPPSPGTSEPRRARAPLGIACATSGEGFSPAQRAPAQLEESGGSDCPGFCSAGRAPSPLTWGRLCLVRGQARWPRARESLCARDLETPGSPAGSAARTPGLRAGQDARPRLEGLLGAGSRPSCSRGGIWNGQMPFHGRIPPPASLRILLPVLGRLQPGFPMTRCPRTSPLLS